MAGRSRGVILSLVYWSLRRLLELVVLRFRSEREKEIEIVLLRHQLRVLELWGAKIRRAPRETAICRKDAIFGTPQGQTCRK